MEGDTTVKLYLASPLGFAASTQGFMAELVDRLGAHVTVLNPWDTSGFDDLVSRAFSATDHAERHRLWDEVNTGLGAANEASIRAADGVVAVLDGVDVDSGTASEIGFAYALGKPILGLRTDYRQSGENERALVNLQVQYFIHASGGTIERNVDDLLAAVEALAGRNGD